MEEIKKAIGLTSKKQDNLKPNKLLIVFLLSSVLSGNSTCGKRLDKPHLSCSHHLIIKLLACCVF